MGVFDDIKDSVTSSEKNDSREGQRKTKSFTDTDFDSSSNFQADSLDSQLRDNTGPSNQKTRPQQRQQQGQRNRKNPQRGGNRSPNAQAGRPQTGSDQPQLSQSTQKKMENAGIGPSRNQNQDPGRISNNAIGGEKKQSVSASRDEFEELKAQNEQIIEILKRINSSLQRLG